MKKTLEKIDALIMGQSMKDEVRRIFEEYANRKPVVAFDDIGVQLLPNYLGENYPNSFEMQLSGLIIEVKPENYPIIDIMHATYKRDCKVSVYVEVMP